MPFPDYDSSLKLSRAMKCYGKLLIILNMCPIDFEGRRLNVKVTQGQNLANLGQILLFPDDKSSLKSSMAMKLL